MIWLWILGALILLVLFFPVRFVLHFLKIGEEELEVSLKLWRWELWKSAEIHVEEPVVEPVPPKEDHIESSPSPQHAAPLKTVEQTQPVEPSQPVSSSQASHTSPPSKESLPPPHVSEIPQAQAPVSASSAIPKTDPNRHFYALALHPTLEKEALRLLYRLMRNAWRIFKLKIPVLRVHYGMENPAQLGMMVGGFWGAHGLANAPEGWEMVPAWDKPGFAALQSEVRITITLFRILRFLLLSFYAIIRFAWIGWRLYRAYRKDPTMPDLSAWRRWILQRIAPLVEEVQHDQT